MKNKKIYLIGVTTLFLLVGIFYWFQIRPSQIKHDCSWVENHSEAKPAIPAMTESELRDKGMIHDCTKSYQSIFINNRYKPACESNNQQLIEEYKIAREVIPAKSWWRATNPTEYQFCLHDKGL